jgi:hypothetical protein
VALSDAVNANLGSSLADVSIYEADDQATVGFDNTAITVNETDTYATANVTLSMPSAQTVTVLFQTSDGTAVAPDDYDSTTASA